jgi:hypothetical protein
MQHHEHAADMSGVEDELQRHLNTAWGLTRGNTELRNDLLFHMQQWNRSAIRGDGYEQHSASAGDCRHQEQHSYLCEGHPDMPPLQSADDVVDSGVRANHPLLSRRTHAGPGAVAIDARTNNRTASAGDTRQIEASSAAVEVEADDPASRRHVSEVVRAAVVPTRRGLKVSIGACVLDLCALILRLAVFTVSCRGVVTTAFLMMEAPVTLQLTMTRWSQQSLTGCTVARVSPQLICGICGLLSVSLQVSSTVLHLYPSRDRDAT